MAVTVKHAHQTALPNDPTKDISSDQWNEAHTLTGLGTAAEADTTDFATAAQGALADSAVQPGDLATVATTGAYSDLSGTPTISGTNTGDQTSIVGITGTKAQFDTACTDGNFAYQSDLSGYVSAASPTFTGTPVISEALKLTGIISPSQITANQNDYAPTGFATATILRLDADAARAITGLAGGASGRVIEICNVGSYDLLFANESASSTAANRFAIRRGLILPPNRSVSLWYDGTSSRWRLMGEPPRVCKAFLPSDVVNNNASADTLADLTDLKFAVIAGYRYKFLLYCVYDSAATTTGARFTINGPALTALDYKTTIPVSGTAYSSAAFCDQYQKPNSATGGSIVAGNTAHVEGQITCSVDGYVQAQSASEISSSAITALGGQCYFEYECISA